MQLVRSAITHADVLPCQRYGRLRDELRMTNAARSRLRRIGLGRGASIYFENWDTIWFQLHEMLFLVDRGKTCVDDELRAFGPLVPRGRELVATLTFENSPLERRAWRWQWLTALERRISISFRGERITGREAEIDNSDTGDAMTSVEFTRFEFTPEQARKFCVSGTPVTLRVDHPARSCSVIIPETTRMVLGRDLRSA
jgi:hypothetical protein